MPSLELSEGGGEREGGRERGREGEREGERERGVGLVREEVSKSAHMYLQY